MPVQPNNGKLHIDLSSEGGLAELVDVARALDPEKVRRYGTADSSVAADIGDHLLYLSATHPEWFAPYRELAVTTLVDQLPMDLSVASVLLPGVESSAIEQLCSRLLSDPDDWATLSLLAGTGDAQALQELADVVRTHGSTEWTNRLGVHVGESGPARWRFSSSRYAIVVPAASAAMPPDGVVGSPLAEIADDPAHIITWHYLSLRPHAVDGVPAWPSEHLHIVSPRTYWYTLHCAVLEDGRYAEPVADDDGEPFDLGLREIEHDPPPASTASLHRYDESLIYRNGHVHLTPSVVGDAGGPPIGIYPNPVCPGCGVLMFHVATVETGVREYGEGFRSVFICERCTRAAVTGTNWN